MSEETYEGLSATDVARWLHTAAAFRDELAPEGVTVKSDKHSTATHVYVYLTLEGEEPLLAWYKTNWIAAHYEFNENGEVQGFQPGCDFIRPTLEDFFAAVRNRLKAIRDRREDEESEKERQRSEHRREQLERYRRAYSA